MRNSTTATDQYSFSAFCEGVRIHCGLEPLQLKPLCHPLFSPQTAGVPPQSGGYLTGAAISAVSQASAAAAGGKGRGGRKAGGNKAAGGGGGPGRKKKEAAKAAKK